MEKFLFGNFENLKQIELKNPDMKRQIFYGDNVMIVKNIIAPHTTIPAHKHVHEQISYVESGECDITIDGMETQHAVKGGVALFPSNVGHEVTATGDEELVLWDIFSPIREDFIPAFLEEVDK